MSNFSDVKALLIHNREMHDRTAGFYTDLARQVVSERVKMFLCTLVKHEVDLAKELDNYLQQAPDSILDTFFQFDHNQNIESLYLTPFTPSECSANDVETIATRFDDYLCQLYEEMIRIAENSKVRELFENLHQHMQLEKNDCLQTSIRCGICSSSTFQRNDLSNKVGVVKAPTAKVHSLTCIRF